MSEHHYTKVEISGPREPEAYEAVKKSEHFTEHFFEELYEPCYGWPNFNGLWMFGRWSGRDAVLFVKEQSVNFPTERFKLFVEGPQGLATFQGSMVIQNGRISDVKDREGLTRWDDDNMHELIEAKSKAQSAGARAHEREGRFGGPLVFRKATRQRKPTYRQRWERQREHI